MEPGEVLEPRMMLAGGGDERDSRILDETFACWTLSEEGKMLFLPVALDGQEPTYEACLRWVESVFGPLGVSDIEMWTELGGFHGGRLSGFSSVYLSGGNTFRLLALVRASGFDRELADFIRRGGCVYGGSAGAILLGKDIGTCAHMDANEVGLADTSGLDLVAGHAVWCHYQPDNDVLISDYVAERGIPVLAFSERSGLRVERARMAPWGEEPAFRFSREGKARVRVGDLVFSAP